MVEKPTYELLEQRVEELGKVCQRYKQLEDTLSLTKEKLHSFLKGIPIPTFIWEKDGNDFILRDFSDSALDITAGRMVSVKGHLASELYADRPEILENMSKCFQTKEKINHEIRYHFRTTGKSKFLSITYGFIPPNYIVLHTEDVTKRKMAELNLHHMLDHLEAQVETKSFEILDINDSLNDEISKRKAIEKAYRENESRFRLITEHLQDIIIQYDRNYRHLYVNQIIKKYTNLPSENIIGKTPSELGYPKQNVLLWEKQLERVFTTGEVVRIEVNHEKDLWFDWLFIPEFSESGKIESVIVSGREISKLKRAECNLEKNERLFRTFLDTSQAAILIIQDDRIIYHNKSFSDITGYSADEIKSKNYYEIVDPEMKDIIKNRMKERLENNVLFNRNKIKFVHKNGVSRWVDYSATVHEYDGKKAIFTSAYDITETLRAKEALKESEKKYRSILENMEEGYFESDFYGNLTFFNDALSKITGYKTDELIGLSYKSYTQESMVKKVFKTFNSVYNTGETGEIDNYEVIKKNGEKLFLDVSVRLRRDKDNLPLGFCGIIRDTTAKRNAEIAKKELEHQLQQALRIESIGTLAGGIAHDFNNLLTGIQGNLSIMKLHKPPGSGDYERIRLIENLVQSGSELTRQLLGFAMGGKYMVKPHDLNTLVEKSLNMIDRTKKGIKIIKNFQEKLWIVEVDMGQMEQVLLNLYLNAAHAMPDGGRLKVTTENTHLNKPLSEILGLKPGKYVKTSISDTGIGMTPGTMERIFEPFFTTKKMGRGTGLGLASAYGIIKNHKGVITVDSKEGKGTTFDIFLPISRKKKIAEDKKEENLFQGSETLLFVDDEETVREIGTELLNELGYNVIPAESGQKAIEIYQKNYQTVDMVILDMIMPEMSGAETYTSLKKINPEIKFLLTSGYSKDKNAVEILKNGSGEFIQKPFTLHNLSKKIRNVLEASQEVHG